MEKDSIGFKLGEILFETVNGPDGKHKALKDAVIEAARYVESRKGFYATHVLGMTKLFQAVQALNQYEEVGE